MARTADVVIMMLDATKGEVQRSAVGAGQADSLGRPCGGNRTLATARVSLSSWWVVPGVLGIVLRSQRWGTNSLVWLDGSQKSGAFFLDRKSTRLNSSH